MARFLLRVMHKIFLYKVAVAKRIRPDLIIRFIFQISNSVQKLLN